MSGVSRRALLAGAATAGVGAAVVLGARGGGKAPALAIYDSRLPEARAFAATAGARGIPLHDIAREDDDLWRASRGLTQTPGRAVIGMTGWTDWVSIRGLLAARGLRVRHEAMIASQRRAVATAFEWTMA